MRPKILGATYGLNNVTSVIQSLVATGTAPWTVPVTDEQFGGPGYPGATTPPVLVVVYQYPGQLPVTQAVTQAAGATLTIAAPSGTAATPLTDGKLAIMGAMCGTTDITKLLKENAGPNYLKFPLPLAGQSGNSLTIVYQYDARPQVLVVPNTKAYAQARNPGGQSLVIVPELTILGASYGPVDVTGKVRPLVTPNGRLQITPSNTTFGGDPWPGVTKIFALTYQYGDEQPQTLFVTEGTPVTVEYYGFTSLAKPTTHPLGLNILGAVYGQQDVTTNLQGMIQNNTIPVFVPNKVLPDSFRGTKKSLTIVYQYGGAGRVRTKVVTESDNVTIAIAPHQNHAFLSAHGLFEVEQCIKLTAGNHSYLKVGSDNYLKASASTISDAACLKLHAGIDPNGNPGFKISVEGTTPPGYLQRDKTNLNRILCNATKENATIFNFGLSPSGDVYIYEGRSNKSALFWELSNAEQHVQITAGDVTWASTAFGVHSDASTWSSVRSFAAQESFTPCEIAQAMMVWQLTGGLFLAMGLGPYIQSGKVATGLLPIIKQSKVVSQILDEILAHVNDWWIADAGLVAQLFGALYAENLLWPVVKFLAPQVGWFGFARLVAKVIETVLAPEAELLDLMASMTVWSAQTGVVIYQTCSACGKTSQVLTEAKAQAI